MRWLTALPVMPRLSAAADRLPRRATASKAWIPLSDGSRRISFPILELNSIALANFAFVMAVNTANSILMSREIFNDHAAARQPRPGSRHGLSRELLTMLVSRSDEHTSELQSLMRNSYAEFCLKKT